MPWNWIEPTIVLGTTIEKEILNKKNYNIHISSVFILSRTLLLWNCTIQFGRPIMLFFRAWCHGIILMLVIVLILRLLFNEVFTTTYCGIMDEKIESLTVLTVYAVLLQMHDFKVMYYMIFPIEPWSWRSNIWVNNFCKFLCFLAEYSVYREKVT